MDQDRWRKSSFSGGNNGNCVEVTMWRKSSFSSGNGGQCVEVNLWRKSTFSGGNNGECIELAPTLGGVRDSKNPSGPIITARIDALITAVKHDQVRHARSIVR
ncbi:DUF397 domain-containing protein [Actinokineospora inagensis]|uniref:DUF397 domain-containing protein n=1 Tax=Actinokineospora inagensis TaxID=103730 RepID=UPI0004055F3F|nr:DUF397 domain-containing protein [Actinokineospora inagensis]